MANLYHYTTGAGLLGMMKDYSEKNKNLTMWATHYMYMNDPTEYEYGKSICLNIINDIEEGLHKPSKDCVKELLTKYNVISKIGKQHITSQKLAMCPFLISFSQVEDSLRMWDMYAKKGNGIAIVLNREKLNSFYPTKDCIYYKENVDYETLKQEITTLYTEKINTLQTFSTFPKFEKALYIFMFICLTHGVFIKHLAYEEELETRISIPQTNTTLFREKNGMIIPYMEQQIPFECIENIIVGPTADFDRVRESILLLMNSKGIEWKEDKIIKSKVPYRI